MNTIFKGLRPLDYTLAALATAVGALLMYMDITAHAHGLAHPQSTTTAAMLPFFLAVTVPILWRRRNILAVVGATTVAEAVHVVLFGWNTRCGVVLPLSFALSYAVARFAIGRWQHMLALGIILVLQVVTLAQDSSISTVLAALPIAVGGGALSYGVGRLVQARVNKKQSAAAAAAAAASAAAVAA